MLHTYTFTVDTETKATVVAGNISARVASQYMLEIVLAEEINKRIELKKAEAALNKDSAQEKTAINSTAAPVPQI